MTRYTVYIRHVQTVEVEAEDELEAREKVEGMLIDGFVPSDSDSPYEYDAVEIR